MGLGRVMLPLSLAFLVSCSAVPQSPPTTDAAIIRYDAIHHPVIATGGMVVSQNALASEVGRRVLARGGNAVDAAISVGFALAVTLPRAGNLGGSGFMLLHLASTDENKDGETLAFDYRSMAPANFPVDTYRTDGKISTRKFSFGPTAPAVPGTVAAFHQIWRQHGSLRWEALLEPAIALATDGIEVTDDLAFALAEAAPLLARHRGSRDAYLRADGTPYPAGERLIQTDLAWSLRQIRDHGADAFYRGAIAERIVGAMAQDGGHISRDDLAAYRVHQREPIHAGYRGYQVFSMPPVSGGGVTLIQMLKVLQNFNLAELQAGSAASLHLIAETMKRSAANRRVGIGDPGFVDVPTAGHISDALAKQLAAQIDHNKATPVATIKPAGASKYESRETTHFSIVDRFGNAVANTYTLGYSFGSGYVAPGTGILLDNQMRNFTWNKPGHANAFTPGKRMVSTMTPTIVLDEENEVFLVTGTPGGSRIINAIVQVIINVIDYNMNIAQATHAPRIHQQWRTPNLGVERGIGIDTIRILEGLGHIVEQQQTMGSMQSIMVRDGLLFGAADPRRPGALAIGVE